MAKPLHLCTEPSVLSKQMTKVGILAGAAYMLSLTTVSSPLKTPVIFFSYISRNFFLPVELSIGYILNCHNIPPRNLCNKISFLHLMILPAKANLSLHRDWEIIQLIFHCDLLFHYSEKCCTLTKQLNF